MSGFQGQKLVHLDLKGAPPKLDYLLRLIPLLREWGATGILVEYEDMFHYKGDSLQGEGVSKDYCYSIDDIHRLQQASENENLAYIPLIQTFGHLEFVLKHKKFSSMLETANSPISLCPLHKSSLALVESMVEQMIEAHEDLKYLHVGGDEVFNLGTCDTCRQSNLSKYQLYCYHMIPLLQYIKTKWPNLSLILWHDMIGEYTVDELQAFAHLVEPMAWSYVDNVMDYFPAGMFDRFGQVFDIIWIASSFKGSSGPLANFVPLEHHVANHLSWLELISSLPEAIQCKIAGIAITGWSRYNHFATLCELLPAAIPSLVLCLAILENGQITSEIEELVAQQLGFTSAWSLKPLVTDLHGEYEKGCFPGAELFLYVTYLEKAKYFLKRTNLEMKGWLDIWHRDYGTVNQGHVEHAQWCCNVALEALSVARGHAGKCLQDLYYDETVQEWMTVKVEEKIKTGTQKLEILNKCRKKK